ncbi:VWA domain-containing protein [Gracilinema caldarium]|nr:VWA domain-containing protein [Gracilinema caldarium]
MKTVKFILACLFVLFILMNIGCSSSAPAVATVSGDSTTPMVTAPEPAKDAKSAPKIGLGDTEMDDYGVSEKVGRSEYTTGSVSGRKNIESGLKAGLVDDNTQYNYFLDFLNRFKDTPGIRPVPVENRIILTVLDERKKPIPNALVSVYNEKKVLVEQIKTYADGRVLINPLTDSPGLWNIEASTPGSGSGKQALQGRISVSPQGLRNIELSLSTKPSQGALWVPTPVPLDIVFILDTTGSMGEEIERLKATIEIIRDNLDLATPRPQLRFGLVLYRDRGDDYITWPFPLTENLKNFQSNLAKAKADGGGDTPEDLEAALAVALDDKMGWNPNGARLIFIITDAPAHTYIDGIPYNESVERARTQAIRIHSIGTGGLTLDGEYQLRQISQRSRGKYIFLTYGEKGESEGGAPGAVSHHTGANWTADRLEAIIIRLAKEEISLLSGDSVSVPSDDYYEARAVPERDVESILDELFTETVVRLLDYATTPITKGTRVSLVPLSYPEAASSLEKKNAERFSARLLQAANQSQRFTLVERNDLQAILQELELSLSAIADPASAAKVGNLVGAEYLILPSMISLPVTKGDDNAWEVYLRLVRVATGEIISVSRARISRSLGYLD